MKRCHGTGTSRERDFQRKRSEEKEVSRSRDAVSRERTAKNYFCHEKGTSRKQCWICDA